MDRINPPEQIKKVMKGEKVDWAHVLEEIPAPLNEFDVVHEAVPDVPRTCCENFLTIVLGCILRSPVRLLSSPFQPLATSFSVLHYVGRGGGPGIRGIYRDRKARVVNFKLRRIDVTVGQVVVALRNRLRTPYVEFAYGCRGGARAAPEDLSDLPTSTPLELDHESFSHFPAARFLLDGFFFTRSGVGTYGSSDIGVFTEVLGDGEWDQLSSVWLHGEGNQRRSYHPSVSQVAVAAGGKSGASWKCSTAEVISANARAALIRTVDAAWESCYGVQGQHRGEHTQQQLFAEGGISMDVTADDFKTLLSPLDLTTIIGTEAFLKLKGVLLQGVFAEGNEEASSLRPPCAIVIRRTQATGKWIKWHTDKAARTLCVPLNNNDNYKGGELLFAGIGETVLGKPSRTPGGWIVHDGDLVHGVTQLVRGSRYGLFLIKARKNLV